MEYPSLGAYRRSNMTSVLAFSGSLRAHSFNTRIARALTSLAPEGVTVTFFDISDLPLYNQDLDGDTLPDVVARLRSAVAEADGVVIATPEYNHSYSAVTKNVIDWASRPFAAGPILKKPAMVIAAGPGPGGGVHAISATSELFGLLGCPVVATVGVAGAHEKINADDDIVDDALAQQLRDGLGAFLTLS
ncbi:MAG: hypothetical protein RIR69_1826 [Actinomycetota bacterium]